MATNRLQHRSLLLLAATVGIQVLLLAAQVKRDQDVRLIRVWAVEIVAPLGRSTTWIVDGLRGGWTNYIGVHSLGRENQQLRAEVDRLKLRNAELESRAAEADRLAGLLDFRKHNDQVPMIAARVIGASPTNTGRVAFLDRGAHDGLAVDMGVITPDGVVGKVIAVYPATSQVLLISDKDSGVGALLADSRTQSPVRGSGDPMLSMEYVAKEVKVRVGEPVFTSGQDRIFPKDLPVGVVQSTDPEPHTPFQRIVVKPAAHLDQLEEVLVLLTRTELTPIGAAINRNDLNVTATARTPASAAAASVVRTTTAATVPAAVKPVPAIQTPPQVATSAKPPVAAANPAPRETAPPAPPDSEGGQDR
jgi:rod shape-determining protein MreC